MGTMQLIRDQLKVAHEWLEGTLADVTPEMANWVPPGEAHTIGTRYAHVVASEA